MFVDTGSGDFWFIDDEDPNGMVNMVEDKQSDTSLDFTIMGDPFWKNQE